MAVSPSFAFTAYCDQIGHYATMPGTGSSWGVLLLRLSGLEADATLADHLTVATLLNGTSDEAIFGGYGRKTFTPTRTVNNDANTVTYAGTTEVRWAKAGSSDGTATNDTVAKAIVYYQPSASATDTQRLPLFCSAIRGTTDGNDMTWRLPQGLAVVDSLQAA